MNWYKRSQIKEQQLFRGDPKPISIEDYDHEYASKELGKELGASTSNGPGIYFTTREEYASDYGQYVTRKKLQNANIITKQNNRFNYQQINKILQGIDAEKIKTAISNYDENFNIGKRMLIESILNADNPIDQLMNIWADVFYHQHPNAFIELMIKNGIDGIAIDRPNQNDTHYIIYNKNKLFFL